MFPLSMSAAFGALLYELSITKANKLFFLMRVHSVNLSIYLTVTSLHYTFIHLLSVVSVIVYTRINSSLI